MSVIEYANLPVPICEAARSLPNPPTGAGAPVADWEVRGETMAEAEITILAGATVELAAGAMIVAEEVHKTYPEQKVAVTAANLTETINAAAHAFETGDGPVRLSGSTLPTGLSATTEYWVIKTGTGTLQLAASRAAALAGTIISFSTDGADLFLHWVSGVKSLTAAFTAAAATNICTATGHGLETGERVTVQNTGGALPAPLLALTDYYVIALDANTFSLAASVSNAENGVAIDLTDAGTGTHAVVYTNDGPTLATAYVIHAELNEGAAINLTAAIGYRQRIEHRPGVQAYHLVATTNDFVPLTAYVRGVRFE